MAKRPKGTGSLYKQPTSDIWRCQFTVRGKRYRESTGTNDKDRAGEVLAEKLAKATVLGPPAPASLTVADLVGRKLESDRSNGLRDIRTTQGRFDLHVKLLLGSIKARDLTTDILEDYVSKRIAEGAPTSTCNRELALVRAAYRLARRSNASLQIPIFPMKREPPARKGFLRTDQYEKLFSACMKEGVWLAAAFEVAHSYGWREDEIFGLTLGMLDFMDKPGSVRIPDSKNFAGRLIFMTTRVRELLLACCQGKSNPNDLVITRPAFKKSLGVLRPIVDMRDAWGRATKEAGVPGLLFHDLRRTGVRNLRKLGVTESVAMKISGHKTSNVFRRYDIVDEQDIRNVTERLEAQAHTNGIQEQGMTNQLEKQAEKQEVKWAQQDSNLRPTDYESAALTN